MRRHAATFFLLIALSAGAVETADPATAAIELSERHVASNQFAKAVRVLAPFESLQRADVDYALAYALYSEAVNGVPVEDAGDVDITRAQALAERAAAKGSGFALNLLFVMHSNGFGLPVDEDKALNYLERAVAAGDVGAKINYSVRLYRGIAPLDRDRDKACALFTELQALPDADPISGYYLGLAHFGGHCGFPEDLSKGMAMIEAAARSEVREAQSDMGKSLEFGWTGTKDLKQALAWYQLAADLGEPYAEWRIGMTYVNGEERAKDAAAAVAWFQRSAASEHPLGLGSLAVMAATGDGMVQDFPLARSLYQRAAAAGNSHAYRGLAVMHLRGEGGPADPVRARVLYWQAIHAGNQEEPALLELIEGQMNARQRRQARRDIEALGGELESGGKATK
ncbi:SEL1-like repeat protein [Arenimonas sp. MALMAid1274]|uniref:SEL1-like repeat protein n=1 Tax=Arenimonas sp. MALMAid1274 TaxID=3411630 RepID=UPI003BA018B1